MTTSDLRWKKFQNEDGMSSTGVRGGQGKKREGGRRPVPLCRLRWRAAGTATMESNHRAERARRNVSRELGMERRLSHGRIRGGGGSR